MISVQLSAAFVIIAILIISLSIHEFAHAFIADRLGDPTPRLDGRLTLNPAAHWDPIGTTLLVGLIFLQGLGLNMMVFGWGKEVRVDPRHFKNYKMDFFKTAIAGPISNFIIIMLLSLIVRFIPLSFEIFTVLSTAIYINIFLAVFNLIPIPPLDGSRLLYVLLPEDIYERFEANSSYIIMGLILLIFLFPGILGSITSSIYNLFVG